MLYCVLCQIKEIFSENFLNKQSQNTKQVGVLRNIWDEESWRVASEIISKSGKLFAFMRRREEVNQNGEISSSVGERQQIFDAMVLAPVKIYLLL